MSVTDKLTALAFIGGWLGAVRLLCVWWDR